MIQPQIWFSYFPKVIWNLFVFRVKLQTCETGENHNDEMKMAPKQVSEAPWDMRGVAAAAATAATAGPICESIDKED